METWQSISMLVTWSVSRDHTSRSPRRAHSWRTSGCLSPHAQRGTWWKLLLSREQNKGTTLLHWQSGEFVASHTPKAKTDKSCNDVLYCTSLPLASGLFSETQVISTWMWWTLWWKIICMTDITIRKPVCSCMGRVDSWYVSPILCVPSMWGCFSVCYGYFWDLFDILWKETFRDCSVAPLLDLVSIGTVVWPKSPPPAHLPIYPQGELGLPVSAARQASTLWPPLPKRSPLNDCELWKSPRRM